MLLQHNSLWFTPVEVFNEVIMKTVKLGYYKDASNNEW